VKRSLPANADDPSKIISSEPQIPPLRHASVGMTKAGHGAHILPKWIPSLNHSAAYGPDDRSSDHLCLGLRVLRGWGISFRLIPVTNFGHEFPVTNFRSRYLARHRLKHSCEGYGFWRDGEHQARGLSCRQRETAMNSELVWNRGLEEGNGESPRIHAGSSAFKPSGSRRTFLLRL
jgi:hypothetical protein